MLRPALCALILALPMAGQAAQDRVYGTRSLSEPAGDAGAKNSQGARAGEGARPDPGGRSGKDQVWSTRQLEEPPRPGATRSQTRWIAGEVLPRVHRAPRHVIQDWRRRGLDAPQAGQEWFDVDLDAVLVDVGNGVIVKVRPGGKPARQR